MKKLLRTLTHRTFIAFVIRRRARTARREQIALRPLCRAQEAYIQSRRSHVAYETQLALLHVAFAELDKLTGGRE